MTDATTGGSNGTKGLRKALLSNLYSLTTEQVDELIDDLKLQAEGFNVSYAVDAYDVIHFRFPIDAAAPKDSYDLKAIAEDQAALYEIFYGRGLPVIVPEEYSNELQGYLRYVESTFSAAHSTLETVETLMTGAALPLAHVDPEPLLKLLSEHFTVMLAIVMGLYASGTERLGHILSRSSSARLEARHFDFIKTLGRWRRTDLTDLIHTEITRNIRIPPALDEETAIQALRKHREKRTAWADARIVDRLLWVNSELRRGYVAGELKGKMICLYVSSAARTDKIFRLDEVRRRSRYPLRRTRAQLLALIIHQGDGDDDVTRIGQCIERLVEFKGSLTALQALSEAASKTYLEQQCAECVLSSENTSQTECRMAEFCQTVRSLEARVRQRWSGVIANLALLKQIRQYTALLEARPRGSKHEAYMEFFRRLYLDNGMRDAAMRGMQVRQRLADLQARTAAMAADVFLEARRTERAGLERAVTLRHGRDVVTGAAQHLPLKPILRVSAYREIATLITDYFRTPTISAATWIEEAYARYLELELTVDTEVPGEHELIRCYLYMAYPMREGDERAYQHARVMLYLPTHLRLEFYYVMCWAGRRLGLFAEAYGCANTGIGIAPDDPRFYHGRSLVTVAWRKEPALSSQCPSSMMAAVEDAERAAELYIKLGDNYQDQAVVNYNNVAYFSAMDSDDPAYNLVKARAAIDRLKHLFPRSNWHPHYPEYFHSEATVEYEEFRRDLKLGGSQAQLREKLRNALREVGHAIGYSPKPVYLELRDRIREQIDRTYSR